MLETIGYDAAVAASYAPWDAADATAGRVLRVDRGVCTVLTGDGPRRVTLGGGLLRRIAHDPLEAPFPGDWVVVRRWPDGPLTLELVLPRRTAVARDGADVGSALVPAATNVDVVAVVVGADETRPVRALLPAVGPGAEAVVVALREPAEAQVPAEPGRIAVDLETGAGLEQLLGLLGGRRTLAVTCPPAPTRPRRPRRPRPCRAADLVDAIMGTPAIGGRLTGPELVVLPTGGAVVDVSSAPTSTKANDHAVGPVP